MTLNDLDVFSSNVISLFQNKKLLNEIREGCQLSGEKYTLENMAQNFTDGILNALNHASYRFPE